MKSITITLVESLPQETEQMLIQSVKKLLASMAIKHSISSTLLVQPKDEVPSSLKLEHEFRKIANQKVLIIKADGVVKPSESSSEWKRIEKFLENLVDGAQAVMVNLENVPWVDSVGLGTLVTFYAFLKNHEIKLIFVSPTEKVVNKLRLCRLDTVFNIVDSYEPACSIV